jgi:hypothetical protein
LDAEGEGTTDACKGKAQIIVRMLDQGCFSDNKIRKAVGCGSDFFTRIRDQHKEELRSPGSVSPITEIRRGRPSKVTDIERED